MKTIDIVFIGIILINGLIAYYRGMIKTLFSFFSTILAIGLSYILHPTFSRFIIEYTKIDEQIKEKVGQTLNLDQLAEGVVTKQQEIKLIDHLKLPDMMKEYLLSNNNQEVYNLIDVHAINDYISDMISRMVINALSFIVLFILLSIIIAIVAYTLDLIAKLPVLKQLNSMMGLMIGVALGIVINWVICVVIYVIAGLNGNHDLLLMINDSFISNLFYEYNPLIDIVMDFTTSLNK